MCLGVGLLNHMVALFLVFLATSIRLSIVAIPMYIPTNNVGGFPFLHTLSSICYLLIFNGDHSDWCEVVPCCSFDLKSESHSVMSNSL